MSLRKPRALKLLRWRKLRPENALLEVVKYLKDSSLTNVSKNFTINFIYGPLLRSRAIFEPRTVILEQLKNSGSLRYFKNKELQKLIGDLTVAIQNVNDRQALETQIRLEYLNPILIENYDYDFEIQLRQNRTIDIFTALNNKSMLAKRLDSRSLNTPFGDF